MRNVRPVVEKWTAERQQINDKRRNFHKYFHALIGNDDYIICRFATYRISERESDDMSLSHFTQLLTVFIAQTTQEKPTTLFVFIRYSQLLVFGPSRATTTCFCLFSFAYFTHSRRFCSALIMLTKGRPEHDQPSKALIIFSSIHFFSFAIVHPDSNFFLLRTV